MTDPFETKAEYVRRMADEGGLLASQAEVEANILESFEQMGTVFTSSGSIPSTASVRIAGTFTDANDCYRYLEQGGLVAAENDGVDVIPIGFVYLLEKYDEILMEMTYSVYIDEDTN